MRLRATSWSGRFAQALLGLALVSCATEDSVVVWDAAPRYYDLPPILDVVSPEAHWRFCGNHVSCVQRDWTAGVCRIKVTTPTIAEWLLIHEKKHCKGYEHLPWIDIPNITYHR